MKHKKIVNKSTVLLVTVDNASSTYTVESPKGSSVNEMAFAVMVTIRTLIREGHIKNKTEFDKLVKQYFTDPQYAEVKNEQ